MKKKSIEQLMEEVRQLKVENKMLHALVDMQKAELTRWRFHTIHDTGSQSKEKSPRPAKKA